MLASADSARIFCFGEIWMKPEMTLHMAGFQTFYSPPLQHPGSHQYLPGSCLFIADMLKPEHPLLIMIRLNSHLYPLIPHVVLLYAPNRN